MQAACPADDSTGRYSASDGKGETVKALRTICLILICAAPLGAQQFMLVPPAASELESSSTAIAAVTAPAERPGFWTKQQISWQAVNAGLHIADAVQSCERVHPLRWNAAHTHWTQVTEMTAPFQSCAGIAAWTLGEIPLSVGLSYALHRGGHDRLALLVPQISAGADAVAIGYSFTFHKGKDRK